MPTLNQMLERLAYCAEFATLGDDETKWFMVQEIDTLSREVMG